MTYSQKKENGLKKYKCLWKLKKPKKEKMLKIYLTNIMNNAYKTMPWSSIKLMFKERIYNRD